MQIVKECHDNMGQQQQALYTASVNLSKNTCTPTRRAEPEVVGVVSVPDSQTDQSLTMTAGESGTH